MNEHRPEGLLNFRQTYRMVTQGECINGHDKSEHMNERGVCTKCRDRYHFRHRTHYYNNRTPEKETTKNARER